MRSNTEICCYMFGAKENNLKKSQKPGQATITIANGREEIVHNGMPIIPTVASRHTLEMSKDEVTRINPGKEKKKIPVSVQEAKRRIERNGIETVTKNKPESIRD